MLRPFEDKDLDQVMDIWLTGNLQAHPFVEESYWRGQADRVRELMGQAQLLVWEEAGQVAGFLGLWGEHIEGIFVSPEHQGRGIGKALLQGAKERCRTLTLNVYQDNQRAAAFYRREGFSVAEKDVDPDTGQPEWVMTWTGRETE